MSTWNEQLAEGVAHLKNADPILRTVIEQAPTPSIQPHTNYYQTLAGSIVSQQLSVKAADTILKRFVALFPGDFPSPSDILSTDIETLRSVGLSRQKATYIQDLAAKILDGSVQFDQLDSLTNEEIIAELTQVKGVGVWTVHMFLMFCMGRLDVLPTGDLGIKNGIQRLYGLAASPSIQDMEALATKNQWHPYATLAAWYIWYSLDNKPAV